MSKKKEPKPTFEPADNLIDAYNALDDKLSDEVAFRAYYKERKRSPVWELKEQLLMDRKASKFLFSGQRKSGKTTELRRLMHEAEVKEHFFVVYFSIEEELDLLDVGYQEVLLVSAMKLWKQAKEKKLRPSPSVGKALEEMLELASSEVIKTTVKERSADAGLNARLNLWIAELSGGVKINPATRTEVRKKLDPETTRMIGLIDKLALDIEKKGKRPLLIVDGLDKINVPQAERMFYKYSTTMTRPACTIIYTIPIGLIRSMDFRQIEMQFQYQAILPMIRTTHRNGKPNENGRDLLRSIILERMIQALFADDALDKLVESSNGVLSDIISTAQQCCGIARSRREERITPGMVAEVFDRYTALFFRIFEERHYLILEAVHEARQVSADQDLKELLHMLAVVEYLDDNGEVYYALHPVVVPVVKRYLRDKYRGRKG